LTFATSISCNPALAGWTECNSMIETPRVHYATLLGGGAAVWPLAVLDES
jgi:hypothetical protein